MGVTTQIGPELRRIRQQKGLRISEVAARSNVSKSYVYEVENGYKEPSWGILVGICEALEVVPRVSLHTLNGKI